MYWMGTMMKYKNIVAVVLGLSGILSCSSHADKTDNSLSDEVKQTVSKIKNTSKSIDDLTEGVKEVGKSTCRILIRTERFKMETCYYTTMPKCLKTDKSFGSCLGQVHNCQYALGEYKNYKRHVPEMKETDLCYEPYKKTQIRFGVCVIENNFCEMGENCGDKFRTCLDEIEEYLPK